MRDATMWVGSAVAIAAMVAVAAADPCGDAMQQLTARVSTTPPTLTAAERRLVEPLRHKANAIDERALKQLRTLITVPARTALADALAAVAIGTDGWARAARMMLEERAAAGVGGPYLDALDLADLGDPDAAMVPIARHLQVRADATLHECAVARAIDQARLPPQAALRGCHDGQGMAWTALQELGTLHPGMAVADAIAVLGAPSSRSPDQVIWYVGGSCHVSPVLSAKLDGATVLGFHQGMH